MPEAKMESADGPGVVEQQSGPPAAAEQDAVTALRQVGVFADLPVEQLAWFVANAEERWLKPGEELFRRGAPADRMTVYLEGEVHARRDEDRLDGYVYIVRAGDPATEVSGKLPFSRMTEFPSISRAVTRTRLLIFPERLFPEMLQRMPVLAERLVSVMSDRVRESTKADEQRDRLMALGKLSAGLAHELNNPAAAARRAAAELTSALAELRHADLRLCRQELSAAQRQFIADYEHDLIAYAAPPLGALAQSDREDALGTWLDARQVEDGWRLAAHLVEAGVDVAGLERIAGEVGAAALGDVLARLAAQLAVARLTGEIKTSATRIAELVGAIKEYTYMDQAPVQEVDIHQGLENTLLILKYKLKKKNVSVTREYAENLPPITAYGTQLNQVWTNLIDNAIDALAAEGGTLKLTTKREPDSLLVEIRDNGQGIPAEARSRIFEPFYTTKGVGEGTGLGLDTTARIVRQHQGNIRFESKPGATCFQVRLPLQPSAGNKTRVPQPV